MKPIEYVIILLVILNAAAWGQFYAFTSKINELDAKQDRLLSAVVNAKTTQVIQELCEARVQIQRTKKK